MRLNHLSEDKSKLFHSASLAAAIIILIFGAGASSVFTQTSTCQLDRLYPSDAVLPSQGDSGRFEVYFRTTGPYGTGCTFQAQASQPWITATTAAPYVRYSVGSNSGTASRSGSISVTGNVNTANFSILQSGGGPNQSNQILISNTDPPQVAANSGNFTLRIYGRGFAQAKDTRVIFNGSQLVPSINTGVQITVSVPNALISKPGTVNLSIDSPSLGLASNNVQIAVVSAPGPFISLTTSTSSLPELKATGILGSANSNDGGSIFAASTGVLQMGEAQVTQLTPTTQKWISVTPASFVIPISGSQKLNVTLNPKGLAPGIYTALVKVTSSRSGAAPQASIKPAAEVLVIDTKTVAVTADFTGSSLSPAPKLLSFSYVLNGRAPSAKSIAITPFNLSASGGQTISAAASVQTPPNGAWLSINPSGTSLPGTINVVANPRNLSPGVYLGQVSFTTGSISPVIVDVVLTLKNAPDVVVSFPSYPVGAAPSPQVVTLNNSPNPAGYSLDLNSEVNWLKVTPPIGETPQSLQFSADPTAAGLTPGSYTGYATAVDPNDPANITIFGANLTVPNLPLAISNASLPDGMVDQSYPATALMATGRSGGLTWSISPAALPPGLTLQGATVSGKPTSSGKFTFRATVTDNSNPPVSASKDLTITIAPAAAAIQKPAIVSVSNAASEEPFLGPYAFIEIKGSNLSNITSDWSGAPDFASGRLPARVAGVTVTVNGKDAYVSYVSPAQINALVPLDSTVAPVPVIVTKDGVASNTLSVPMRAVAPAFFQYSFETGMIAATHADNTPVAPVGLYPGSRPAAPNEIIQLWATGFGATNPPIPDGQIFSSNRQLINPVSIQIGGVNANVEYAALVGPGLYQINVRIPASLANGQATLKGFVQNAQTASGVTVTVGR